LSSFHQTLLTVRNRDLWKEQTKTNLMFESNDLFPLLSRLRSDTSNMFSQELVSPFHRYICQNKFDRDSIIEDIFTVCFNREYIKYSGEYKVIKVNKVGRHQER
jgi:hypothetical protein